jgi:hypothetical protein
MFKKVKKNTITYIMTDLETHYIECFKYLKKKTKLFLYSS